jgi:predicted transcriptional regulator
MIPRENTISSSFPSSVKAYALDIDPAILSKIEHGKRKAERDLVKKMMETILEVEGFDRP